MPENKFFFSERKFCRCIRILPLAYYRAVKANGWAELCKKTSGHLVSLSTSLNRFALFVFVLSNISAMPAVGQEKSFRHTFNGPDRTITWKRWQQSPEGEYRFRTGDRYLGHRTWEHYLGFEEPQPISKVIKLFMIHLANDEVREEVFIRPGTRYAILKVTNDAMTAHKGAWSWTAQELD